MTFDERYDPSGLSDPYDARHSQTVTNASGVEQGTCVHLGDCDIGCAVRAKNTLDLNYLAVAEQNGADIRARHLVDRIEPEGTAYRVDFRRADGDRLIPDSLVATRVVLAAGSLGSTELLLRCRDLDKTLPNLSRRLGRGWSANGDFLTPAIHSDRIGPTEGPTITARIDHLDGRVYGEPVFVQDGGFPDLLDDKINELARGGSALRLVSRVVDELREPVNRRGTDRIMPWFGQALDAADGRLRLRRKWWFIGRREIDLRWRPRRSKRTVDALIAAHRELAKATDAEQTIVSPAWTHGKTLVTPHPLGGCNMADGPRQGVVDHAGEVFGYPRLHVVCGAAIPRAIGRNPSRTIAAVAERAVSLWA